MMNDDLFRAPGQTDPAAQAAQGMPLSRYLATLTSIINYAPQLRGVWVVAELSDVRSSGGHCYMELVEKDAAGRTLAKIRANIWRDNYVRLEAKLRQSNPGASPSGQGFRITSGLKVMVRGSATHHPVYGLSFNIIDIDPTYTLGDIERRRREIVDALARAGLADRNKQETLSLTPQRIAVISAGGAAGFGDFAKQLAENRYGYKFYPHLFPAVMQGDRTSLSIRQALEQVEMTYDLWDCVVIIRGGGATTDLAGFDDLELGRAVALCPLPVLVGIGHERDNTVLDYIAHTRCKTPTAVAAFLIDRLQEAEARALQATSAIVSYVKDRLAGEQRRLANSASLLPAIAQRRLEVAQARLRQVGATLPLLARGVLQRESQALQQKFRTALGTARTTLARHETRLTNFSALMPRLAGDILQRQEQRLRAIAELIGALDPQATLRRGYSITRLNGHAVTDPSALKPGDLLTTTLATGTITSQITDTQQLNPQK